MFCPFMSTATSQAPCSSNCALHLRGGCAIVLNAQITEKSENEKADSLEKIIREIKRF